MNEIQLIGADDIGVKLSPDFLRLRDVALHNARNVVAVKNDASQREAIVFQKNLKELLSGIEKTRKEIKEPILIAGKQIDSLAKEATAEVVKEHDRIQALTSKWEADKIAAREAEERKAREEAARKEQERLKLEEAERQRIAEIDRKRLAELKKSKDEMDRFEAELKASEEKRKIQEAQIARAKFELEEAARKAALPVKSDKTEGAKVRVRWTFELLDVHQLYMARPDLVTLTPKTEEINFLCNEHTNIPGIRAIKETKTI